MPKCGDIHKKRVSLRHNNSAECEIILLGTSDGCEIQSWSQVSRNRQTKA